MLEDTDIVTFSTEKNWKVAITVALTMYRMHTFNCVLDTGAGRIQHRETLVEPGWPL